MALPIPPDLLGHPQPALELRRARVAHAQQLEEAVQDSLGELRAFMPWAHLARAVTEQHVRMVGLEAKWDAGEEFVFHMFAPDDSGTLAFAGCLGFHPRCLNPRGLEIGYWTRTQFAGRGLCTRAVQCLIVLGFEHMGLERIQIGHDVANAASQRVIEKVGFTYEGVLRASLPTATASMRADGALSTGNQRHYSLIRDERETLPWYSEALEAITPQL